MTSHTGRLYAIALTLVVFFLGWAVVAAHPWAKTGDPRLQALAVRQAALQREAKLVQTIVAQRRRLATAKPATAPSASSTASVASAPVKVVNLPPLTVTRTS